MIYCASQFASYHDKGEYMRQRIKCPFLTSFLLSLIVCSAPLTVQAEAEVAAKVLATMKLDKRAIDVATTPDGKRAYILTPGEVQAYSLITRTLSGRIPIDMDVRHISVSLKGDQLLLMHDKDKTLSVVSLAFSQMFTVAGSPFKGPAKAPVVITVFSDYQ